MDNSNSIVIVSSIINYFIFILLVIGPIVLVGVLILVLRAVVAPGKRCPHCYANVPTKASVCKFCGRGPERNWTV